MVDDGRGLLAGRRPSLALELLEGAAALWRGRPYPPLSDQDWATAAVARLDETRTQALELQLDALLDLGRAEQVVVASEPLVREMPYREHLWAARMLALHRCGRTEQAPTDRGGAVSSGGTCRRGAGGGRRAHRRPTGPRRRAERRHLNRHRP